MISGKKIEIMEIEIAYLNGMVITQWFQEFIVTRQGPSIQTIKWKIDVGQPKIMFMNIDQISSIRTLQTKYVRRRN